MNRDEPKTVYLQGDGYSDGELVYDTAICPSCGYVLDDDYDQENLYEPYCPHCGQRLNWEIGEEKCD